MSNKHNMTNPNNMTNMQNISKYAKYHNMKKMPKLCPEICRKMQSIPHCMDATTSSTSATSVTSSGSADAFGRLKVRVTRGAVGFDAAFTSTRRRRRCGRCGDRRGGIFHASTCSPQIAHWQVAINKPLGPACRVGPAGTGWSPCTKPPRRRCRHCRRPSASGQGRRRSSAA